MHKSKEPQIPSLSVELTKNQFSDLLACYTQIGAPELSARYFRDYLLTCNIDTNDRIVGAFIHHHPNLGYVCRIQMRGAQLPASTQRWVAKQVEAFRVYSPPVELGNDRPQESDTPAKPVQTIQDRMRLQTSKCLGDLEGYLDEVILSNFKKTPSPLGVLRQHQIKGPQAQQIILWFKKVRDEFRLAHSGDDPYVREAYSNFSHPELNKLAGYCDQIIFDCLVIVKESLDNRSPRRKKKKLPEQIAKRVRYLPVDDSLKVTSIEPHKVVGAMHAWTYHVKSRTLTLHTADDASGLSFKGTSIINTNAALCVTKRLRKPEQTLHEVLNGGKGITKKLMDGLTTKATRYKNRLSKETLIVRIHK